VGDGGKELNTVYVDDVVRAALLADESARAAGQVYNVTDGRNTTICEFVTHVAELLGVPPPTRHVPAAVAKVAAAIMESAARAAGAKSPPPLNRSRLRFLYYNQRYSIEKARQELGYDPQVSYKEGLPPALAWIAATSAERAPAPAHTASGVLAHQKSAPADS
jgi:nucleoside-diphosphate-sugar epimerase